MLEICSLVVAFSLSQASPAADTTGSVAGRITLEGANTPISGARVILVPTGPPARPMGPMGLMRPIGPPPQATTDQDGRYVFPRIRPGAYHLQVEKTGYAPLVDASRGPVQVVAGQSAGNVDVQLQRGAVIAGKVLDSAGEPLPDARVMALRRLSQPGAPPRLMPAGGIGQQTNDIGEFRIAGLPPGEYYVAAISRPASMMFGGPGVAATTTPARTARQPRMTTATTYYPGTSDQGAAQPIAVAAGAESGNIVFTMQTVPSFRVSGVVVDEQGNPVGGAMITLIGNTRDGMFMGPAGHARTQDSGRFDIDDVPAGSYRANASIPITFSSAGGNAVGAVSAGVSSGVVVSSGGGGSWMSTTSFSGETLSGGAMEPPVEIVVADSDVKDVRVTVRRPTAR